MKSKKVTIKNIAQAMDLTPATISKALRDSSDISVATRKRVKEMAEEMGYQPNIMARSLVSQKSNLLGIIVPDLSISFFSEVVRGVYERARSCGYEAIIMVNDEDMTCEKRSLDFLNSLHVDGILINAVPGEANNVLIRRLIDHGIAMVAYDRTIDGMDISSVTIDDEKAAYEVIRYFIQQGRREILFLGPTKKLSVARGRYRGYRRALDEFNVTYRPELVVPCDIDADDARHKLAEKLAEMPEIDAVMCVGGLVALGAGKAILSTGKSIPEDVMLAEFGDNSVVHRLGVPFVTVHQSPYEMGCEAVDLVIEHIDKKIKQHPYKKIIIDTKLIEYRRSDNGCEGCTIAAS